VKLWKGEPIPEPISFHLLILMGGPMSVNNDDLHPFLAEEKTFVRRWIEEGNSTIGICLGAQLIADCLGARVYTGSKEELGWYELMSTEDGKNDPLLRGFPPRFPVFQWHAETFDLPDDTMLLATSHDYPHQAFRFGDLTYAFQFHLEVTGNMVRSWLSGSEVDEAKQRSIVSSLRLQLPVVHQLCRNFMQSFLDSIERLSDTRRERPYAHEKRNNTSALG